MLVFSDETWLPHKQELLHMYMQSKVKHLADVLIQPCVNIVWKRANWKLKIFNHIFFQANGDDDDLTDRTIFCKTMHVKFYLKDGYLIQSSICCFQT